MSFWHCSTGVKLLVSMVLAAGTLLAVTFLVAGALEGVIFFSLFVGIPLGVSAALVVLAGVWLAWRD